MYEIWRRKARRSQTWTTWAVSGHSGLLWNPCTHVEYGEAGCLCYLKELVTDTTMALEPLLGHRLPNPLGYVQFKFTASRGQKFPLRSEARAELAPKPFKWFQEPKLAPSQGPVFLKTAWLLLPQTKMVSLRVLADRRRRV